MTRQGEQIVTLLDSIAVPRHVDPILKGASGRLICRVSWREPEPGSAIAYAWAADRPDNSALVPVARALHRAGINVPDVYLARPALPRAGEAGAALFQDLGSEDLLGLATSREPEEFLHYYFLGLTQARRIHTLDMADLPPLQPPFDSALYRWEQEYFANNFLTRYAHLVPGVVEAFSRSTIPGFPGVPAGLPDLPPDFADLADREPPSGNQEVSRAFLDLPDLAELGQRLAELPRRPIHRDFQSQNILIHQGQAFLIDFQGLRPGIPEYDLASLVWDAYVELTPQQADEVLRFWETLTEAPLRPEFFAASTQRLLQMLGAFAHIAHNLGKTQYLEFIPRTWRRLQHLSGLAAKWIPHSSCPE